ncbi:hypothetical protein A2U01_0061970, partial [Trifolium medium]|nr:hypothetical protein [Trifolium medium]
CLFWGVSFGTDEQACPPPGDEELPGPDWMRRAFVLPLALFLFAFLSATSFNIRSANSAMLSAWNKRG